jgi:glycosyltransferase involved in cell wall biosynthesis
MRILFVTWDGPQVDYLEGLFLPIFAGLARHGVHFDVLQFRWGDQERTRRAAAACEAAKVGYRSVCVARFGALGAMATALAGGRHVRRAVRDWGSDAVMPRILMPGLAVLAAGTRCMPPLIFDADGLAADERVDIAGASSRGVTVRVLRAVERRLIRTSAAVLVRSQAAADILRHRSGITPERFHVVTNGRDEALFQPFDEVARQRIRADLAITPSAPLLVYAGSVGPQYRFDLIRDFVLAAAQRRPDARFLLLTGSPELAHQALGANPPLSPIVKRVPPHSVPRYLAAADLGLAFRNETFSSQGVAPLKLAEYLMCGLPVVGTAAVGATVAAVEAGVFLDGQADLQAAADWWVRTVLPERESFRTRARAVGLANFSLARSLSDYRGALQAALP